MFFFTIYSLLLVLFPSEASRQLEGFDMMSHIIIHIMLTFLPNIKQSESGAFHIEVWKNFGKMSDCNIDKLRGGGVGWGRGHPNMKVMYKCLPENENRGHLV